MWSPLFPFRGSRSTASASSPPGGTNCSRRSGPGLVENPVRVTTRRPGPTSMSDAVPSVSCAPGTNVPVATRTGPCGAGTDSGAGGGAGSVPGPDVDPDIGTGHRAPGMRPAAGATARTTSSSIDRSTFAGEEQEAAGDKRRGHRPAYQPKAQAPPPQAGCDGQDTAEREPRTGQRHREPRVVREQAAGDPDTGEHDGGGDGGGQPAAAPGRVGCGPAEVGCRHAPESSQGPRRSSLPAPARRGSGARSRDQGADPQSVRLGPPDDRWPPHMRNVSVRRTQSTVSSAHASMSRPGLRFWGGCRTSVSRAG